MGVLKKITDEYFGNTTREEDFIDIDGIDVEVVSFTDKNGVLHKHGYRVVKSDNSEMVKTLMELIRRAMEKRGDECSLNDIDVSNMETMCVTGSGKLGVFEDSTFDGDISGWDVSNVKYMIDMFYCSYFSGKNGIFRLEKGNKVVNMLRMFKNASNFNCDISKWDVSGVKDMVQMFNGSNFSCDISGWNVKSLEFSEFMFSNSPLNDNPPEWYFKKRAPITIKK